MFIGISETWFSDTTVSRYNIDGYQIESIYRTMSRGGGVSLLIQSNLGYTLRSDLCVNNDLVQILFIQVDKTNVCRERDTLIGVLYRPPNTDIKLFNEFLSEFLITISNEKKSIYLMGDFNINLLNEKVHSLTSEFVDNMFANNLYPLITKPTRITRSVATLIDNIYCNDIEVSKHFNGILCSDISDHFPVFCISSTDCDGNSQVLLKTRSYSSKNVEKFKAKLADADWSSVYESDDPSSAFSLFYNLYSEMYNECFPYKYERSKYKVRKLWLTYALKCSIKHKNKLYVKSLKNPTDINVQNYKDYKHHLHRILRLAERQYYDENI
jgi:hypothetical protein